MVVIVSNKKNYEWVERFNEARTDIVEDASSGRPSTEICTEIKEDHINHIDQSLLHVIQTGSGAHPSSNSVGTWGSFPGGKAVRAWSLPPISN
jgi:hypothetical protein